MTGPKSGTKRAMRRILNVLSKKSRIPHPLNSVFVVAEGVCGRGAIGGFI